MYDYYYTNLFRKLALYFRDSLLFSGLIYKFDDNFKNLFDTQSYILLIGCRPKYMNTLIASIFNLISTSHLIDMIKTGGS